MAVHCSLELKKKKTLFETWIKIIQVVSFFYILLFSHRASPLVTLIWSSISQNSLKLTLSTSLSQAHSFIAAGPTHSQRCRHRSSTSLTHQPSQAADQPQTHATIHLRPTSLLLIHFRSVISVFFMWMLGIFDLGITSKNEYNIKECGQRILFLVLSIYYFRCNFFFFFCSCLMKRSVIWS